MLEATFLRLAFGFIEELDRADGIDALLAVTERTLASFGLEYFTFQDFPDPEKYEDFLFCSRVPDEWLTLYIREKYNRVDPAFRLCPRTAEFVRRVEDFGLTNGLMVPIPRIPGRSGVVWFGGSKPDLNIHTLPS